MDKKIFTCILALSVALWSSFASSLNNLTTQEEVQLLYIGLLGRAADAAGLAYWENEINNGRITLDQLRTNLVNEQPEYQQNYGQLSNYDLIVAIYRGLFNREPDKRGLLYWENELNQGKVSPDQLVVAYINGAQTDDQGMLTKKLLAAECYSQNEGFYSPNLVTKIIADLDNTAAYSQCPPSVDAGFDISAVSGGTVTLNGNGTDLESGVSYTWTQISGPSVIINNPNAAQTSFVAPTLTAGATEKVIFQLSVIDDAGASSVDTVSVDIGAPVATLTISPAIIFEDESATLTWNASGVDSCASSGDWSGTRALTGTQAVSPGAGNYTYTLICQNSSGTVSSTANLSVLPRKTTTSDEGKVEVAVSPETINEGESATISWVTSDVNSCIASGAWNGSLENSGSQTVTPTAGNYDYTVTCQGTSGAIESTASLLVNTVAFVDLKVTPTSITDGESAEISWTSSGVTSCLASGAWSGNINGTGTTTVSPPAGTYEYQIICQSNSGSLSDISTLEVAVDVDVDSIETLVPGQSLSGQLGADGDNDRYAIILEAGTTYLFEMKGVASGVGTVEDTVLALFDADGNEVAFNDDGGLDLESRIVFTPDSNGTYYLLASAYSADELGSYEVSVELAENAELVALELSSQFIIEGQSATLSWNAGNLSNCQAYGAWDGPQANTGSLVLSPSVGEHFYLLECESSTDVLSSSVWLVVDLDLNAGNIGNLEAGTTNDGSLDSLGESDRYAVYLEAGVKYAINLRGAPSGWGTLADPLLHLFNESGWYLASDDDGGVGEDSFIEFVPDTSGIYYLAAESFENAGTGTYHIQIEQKDIDIEVSNYYPDAFDQITLSWSSFGASNCEAWGGWSGTIASSGSATVTALPGIREYGVTCLNENSQFVSNSVELYVPFDTHRGTELTVGVQESGNVTAGNSTDYFVELTAGQLYVFEMKGSGSGSGTLSSPYLQLFDIDGLPLNYAGGDHLDSYMEYTPTQSGTFYLSAQSYLPDEGGTFEIRVSEPAGLTISLADSFFVEGESTQLTWSSGIYSSCYVYGPYLYSEETSGSISVSPPAGYHTYAIECDDGKNTDYADATLWVDLNIGNVTQQIEPGTSTSGNLAVEGEADRYYVYLETGFTYVIELLGAPSGLGSLEDPLLQLFDTNGWYLDSDDDSGNDTESRITVTPGVSGNYFISAESFGLSESGTYTLKVTKSDSVDLYALYIVNRMDACSEPYNTHTVYAYIDFAAEPVAAIAPGTRVVTYLPEGDYDIDYETVDGFTDAFSFTMNAESDGQWQGWGCEWDSFNLEDYPLVD